MNRQDKRNLTISLSLLVAFILWTILVMFVDVKAIGPNGSKVGLGAINEFFFKLFGESATWDKISDIFMLFALAVAGVFAVFGVYQLIKRKSLKKVDADIIILALLYVAMAIFYVLFEKCVINYRPIIVEGELEASYPSSHTLLVCTILGSAIYQAVTRIKNKPLKITACAVLSVVMLFNALGRLLSGMHWFTDVVGGVILSAFLVSAYLFFAVMKKRKN